jgi:hypothetical protein
MLSKRGYSMFIALFLGLGVLIIAIIAISAWLFWWYIL